MAIDISTIREKTRALWRHDEPPDELRWILQLSPLHYRLFIAELHNAYSQASIDDDWDQVAELLEDWEATAALDAAPDFADELLAKRDGEFEEIDPNTLP